MSNGINPKSVDTKIEPEVHGFLKVAHHIRVVKVQVRLFSVELVQVKLPSLLVERPCRATENAFLLKQTNILISVTRCWIKKVAQMFTKIA